MIPIIQSINSLFASCSALCTADFSEQAQRNLDPILGKLPSPPVSPRAPTPYHLSYQIVLTKSSLSDDAIARGHSNARRPCSLVIAYASQILRRLSFQQEQHPYSRKALDYKVVKVNADSDTVMAESVRYVQSTAPSILCRRPPVFIR